MGKEVFVVEKVRYMISDAANLAQVEAHVLRYWEDELDLDIPRNEMGHRYYTRENIKQFQRIKELKEQGYQLKAIRMILHSGEEGWDAATNTQSKANQVPSVSRKGTVSTPEPEASPEQAAEERMAQFRELMSDIVGHAIALNNEELSETIGREVGERVLKEMDYLAREQEEAQEIRYRKLDAAIRSRARSRKPIFSGQKEDRPGKLTRKERKELAKAPDPATT